MEKIELRFLTNNMRPKKEDCPEYYNYYIDLIKQDNVVSALTETKKISLEIIRSIPTSIEDKAYAEGKWTIKQLLIHCIDTERIFSTRALNFARGETQKVLSYDENLYGANSQADLRTLTDIIEEFEAVRNATICLFKSFSAQTLNKKGETPSGQASVNAIGFTICGHMAHHLNILQDRYLQVLKN